jgi:ABC-type Fe3+/spermidine/putrescine transport system ATPase subunit
MPPAVQIDRVRKTYPPSKRGGAAVEAVRGVSLEVAEGETLALLGPSGCGKTTLLRMVAGFEAPDDGRTLFSGADLTAAPPQQRPTAMVFQSYALFPTMTVGENVGYGMYAGKQRKKLARPEVRRRVAESLERVGLGGLEDRKVGQLSGGQQQRVALARALAAEPAVVLFDEPLSNLDLRLRESARAELKRMQASTGATSLYVTHDQAEALALADQIAVLSAGQVVEVGPPERLWTAPETAFVAGFLGSQNVIEDAALATRLTGRDAPPGHALAVRPEHLAPAEADAPGAVPARLVARLFLGTHAEWTVEADGTDGPVPLRLWADPARAVPERLAVRAAEHRWVRMDDD